MADLHIVRTHVLGMAQARKTAFQWAEDVEKQFGMACTYEEGRTSDVVQFKRTGVEGRLQVTKDSFTLDAKLGFLLGAFKERIESEITSMLDAMLPVKVTTAPAASAAPAKTARKKAASKP